MRRTAAPIIREGHTHGANCECGGENVDLHVWLSPRTLRQLATNVRKSLDEVDPEGVPAPDQAERTLYDVWSADKGAPPAFPLPGGGSDHEAFLFHLGIPAAGCSYAGRMGVYHSIYDTTDWLERFGDPGYRRHSAVGRLVATAALRIANADVRPLDYASYVEELLPTLAGFEMPGKVSAAVAGALDEATAHLDSESEVAVQRALLVLRPRFRMTEQQFVVVHAVIVSRGPAAPY